MITAEYAQQFIGKNVTVARDNKLTGKTTVSGKLTGLATSGMLSVIDSIVIDSSLGPMYLGPSLPPITIPFAEIDSISLAGGMNIAGMNIDWNAVLPAAITGVLAFGAGIWYEKNYGKKARRK